MTNPRRIDTHQHIVPPALSAWLTANGLPSPSWTAEAALKLMDRNGIESAVLSAPTPGLPLGTRREERLRSRETNEFAANVVRQHPHRFGFFASLPLPDVAGALIELAYAFDTLGADGVGLLSNVAGKYLGDPSFDALFDELNRRKAVIFVHPSYLPGAEPVDGISAFVADVLLDTTRAALRLSTSGTMQRCPDIRVILSHAGGFVPYAASRLALNASPIGNPADGLANLRRFYFDTALSSGPFALPSLLAFASPGHITFGSDWPFAPDVVVGGFARAFEDFELGSSLRESVDRGAAEALFPRFRGPARV